MESKFKTSLLNLRLITTAKMNEEKRQGERINVTLTFAEFNLAFIVRLSNVGS